MSDKLDQPCKSCGRDDAVREPGLMCEGCQRESKFTVSGKELNRHLEEMHRGKAEHVARMVEAHKLHLAEVRAANDEHCERLTRARREDRAHHDKAQMEAAAREDARLRRSMLHRLYAMFLSRRVARHVSPEADPYDRSGALEEALHAQVFFDAEAGDGGSQAQSGGQGRASL